MSLVTFHIKICYNTTSDRITVLVFQEHKKIRFSKYNLWVSVSYICYWHFKETAIKTNFWKLNTFLFRFSIILNEINLVIMRLSNPLKKLDIISLKECLSKISIYRNRYAIILVFVKKYNFRISALYIIRLLYFSMLTTLRRFSFNTIKSAQHWEKCKSK
jgi:hypothetical protein